MGWPFADGAMACFVRGHDWSGTPLGPIAGWSHTLRSAVATLLETRFPATLAWGPDRIGFYNDAFLPLLGDRPQPVGRSVREVWADVWTEIGPVIEDAFRGHSHHREDVPLAIRRPGRADPSWWTLSCAPIRDDDGVIAGAQTILLETTARMRMERRQLFLIGLGDRLRGLTDATVTAAVACEELGRHLGADRVGYAEIDLEGGIARVGPGWTSTERLDRPGAYALHEFGEPFIATLAAGRTAVVSDVSRDDLTRDGTVYGSFGIGAILVAPLIRAGRWVNALSVAVAAPRRWTQDEGNLVAEVAERTWDALERARAEAALRASQHRLESALQAARMVAWDWGPVQDRLAYTGAVTEVFGLSPNEGITHRTTAFELVHPDDLRRHRATVEAAAASQRFYESEFRIVRPRDGAVTWLQERASPRQDPVTGETGFSGLVWDVTRRKRAEIEREEARRMVADDLAVTTKLHEWSVRSVWDSDLQPVLEEILKDTLAILGVGFGIIRMYDSEEDILRIVAQHGFTRDFLERFATVDPRDAASLCARAFRTRRRVIVENAHVDHGETDIRPSAEEAGFVGAQASPLVDRSGVCVGILSTFSRQPTKVSERSLRVIDLYAVQMADLIGARRARDELAASEHRLRALIEGIPQLVWRSTADGRATWHSPQWFAFTGSEPSRGVGEHWRATIHPDDAATVDQAWKKAAEIGRYEVECRIWCAPEARYRWFQVRARPGPAAGAGSDGPEWFGTSTDIDGLRTLQEHQRTLLAELQHRVRHTLSRLRTVLRGTSVSGEHEDYVLRLDGRLDALTRAQGPVTRDPHAGVDLHELVANELLAHQAREGERASLRGPPVRLRPDAADLLALAVHELAVNAVEHGALSRHRGRIGVEWRIAASPEGERLVLAWTETGGTTGAVPEHRGFGFELLERLLPRELGARTQIGFPARGLRCTLDLPFTPRIALI